MRREVQRSINGYLQSDCITRDIDQLIVTPGLGTCSGVLGAMALAIAAE
jgi:fructokinase